MQKNVGSIDRGVRGLIGVTLLLIFFVSPPASALLYWGSLVVGIVMVGTAAIGWCPPYMIFGINTCGTNKDAS